MFLMNFLEKRGFDSVMAAGSKKIVHLMVLEYNSQKPFPQQNGFGIPGR